MGKMKPRSECREVNLMEEGAASSPFAMMSDKDGTIVDAQGRYPADQALLLINEVFASTEQPTDKFELAFAIRDVCNHLGWTAYELAALHIFGLSSPATPTPSVEG